MIEISDIEDIGNGQKRCRVVLTEDMRVHEGTVLAGEYDPFIVDPADELGLGPVVRAMIEAGQTTRNVSEHARPDPA